MHTLGLGNLFDAFAKNDVSIDPAALDLRQGVEGVPEPDKQLHALQKLLGSGLMQAGGVFDPVLTVQGILRFVPGEPPLVGRFIADAGPECLGHFLGDFDKLILRVPIIKIFQIVNCTPFVRQYVILNSKRGVLLWQKGNQISVILPNSKNWQ